MPEHDPSTPGPIVVQGARTHNLKNIDLELPANRLIVITGVSGSGKSSLAFDTIYAEGQRRYVESLSAYARQFLERMEKPDVDRIDGVSPAIAIRQKNTIRNPRSTVATTTEIHDYLRLLYARIGRTFCQGCGQPVERESAEIVARRLAALPEGTRVVIGFEMPVVDAPGKGALNGADAVDEIGESDADLNGGNGSNGSSRGTPSGAGETARNGRPSGQARGRDAADGADADPVTATLRALRKKGFGRVLIGDRAVDFDEVEGNARQQAADSGQWSVASGQSPVEGLPRRSGERPAGVAEAGGPSTVESLPLLSDGGTLRVVVDRVVAGADQLGRLTDSIEIAYGQGGGAAFALEYVADGTPGGTRWHAFSERFECRPCGLTYEDPQPRLFSFNSPFGACATCHGFGNVIELDMDLVVPDPTLTIQEGAIEPWSKPHYRAHLADLKRAARRSGLRLDTPWEELTDAERRLVIEGDGDGYEGVRAFFDWLERKKYKVHVRVFLSRYRSYQTCPDCGGRRLRREARGVRVGGRSIDEVSAMTVREAERFFGALELTEKEASIAAKVLAEVAKRLRFLLNVGLDYLTLDRLSSTLSGGESQRINLATSLGSALVGPSTCSTSRRSACTRATTAASSPSSGSSGTRGTRCSWWSTTPT